MTGTLKLMAVLAHPDDESLGTGGSLAKYGSEGMETYVVTATRGERGRFYDGTENPGPEAMGRIREQELLDAADVLGVEEVSFLDYMDGALDQVDPNEAIGKIVQHLRRVRPQVVLTFDQAGAYGHADHIAICQFTTAAAVAAADAGYLPGQGTPQRDLEAVLHLLVGTGVGRLPGRLQEAHDDGRWCGTPSRSVAGLGDHHPNRHPEVVAAGLEGDILPRIAGVGI